jgi:uncharacterized membrane protein YhfC
MDILLLTRALNGLLMIAIPVALAIYLTRYFHTGWRLVWIGAATFVLSQVGHIPFNYVLFKLFENGVLPTPPGQYMLVFNSLILGLSAGLWEEGARYASYRWWAKDARSWGKALVFGAGHGGIEAILLGILVLLTYVQLISIRDVDLSTLVPADQLALAQAQVDAYWSAPWYLTLLGALERASSLPFHLSASVLVLQVFTRGQIRWLFFAIAWHTLLDAVAVYSAGTWGPYVAEALIAVFALFSIAIIFLLRQPEPEPETREQADLPPVKDAQALTDVAIIEETSENLENSRYN